MLTTKYWPGQFNESELIGDRILDMGCYSGNIVFFFIEYHCKIDNITGLK